MTRYLGHLELDRMSNGKTEGSDRGFYRENGRLFQHSAGMVGNHHIALFVSCSWCRHGRSGVVGQGELSLLAYSSRCRIGWRAVKLGARNEENNAQCWLHLTVTTIQG